MSTQRVTYAGAAEILGCHVSNVAKLIAKGQLDRHPHHPDGSLNLHQVEQLAATRAAARVEAARQRRLRAQQPPRRTPRWDPRPDDVHSWLSAEGAGQVLGITAQAVRKRAQRGTIPHTRAHGRIWIRADHFATFVNARLAAAQLPETGEVPNRR